MKPTKTGITGQIEMSSKINMVIGIVVAFLLMLVIASTLMEGMKIVYEKLSISKAGGKVGVKAFFEVETPLPFMVYAFPDNGRMTDFKVDGGSSVNSPVGFLILSTRRNLTVEYSEPASSRFEYSLLTARSWLKPIGTLEINVESDTPFNSNYPITQKEAFKSNNYWPQENLVLWFPATS